MSQSAHRVRRKRKRSSRGRREKLVSAFVLAGFILFGFLLLTYGREGYKRWRESRLLKQANEMLGRGDFNGADHAARHALEIHRDSLLAYHALAGINRAKYTALRRLYSGLKMMTLLAVGLVGIAALAAVIGTARKVTKAATRGAKVLGTAERIDNPGVKEPSGIAFYPPNGHLFVVGDEGLIAELDGNGKVLKTTKIEAQVEDVAVHTPSGMLMLISESRSELILYDPASGQEKKRWPLDLDSMLGTTITDRNQGFEGLTFRPEEGQPGGGVFYLTHQRAPSMVIGLAFDPAAPVRRLGADTVLSRWPLSYEDLTAITWAQPLGRLLVIADAKDRLRRCEVVKRR